MLSIRSSIIIFNGIFVYLSCKATILGYSDIFNVVLILRGLIAVCIIGINILGIILVSKPKKYGIITESVVDDLLITINIFSWSCSINNWCIIFCGLSDDKPMNCNKFLSYISCSICWKKRGYHNGTYNETMDTITELANILIDSYNDDDKGLDLAISDVITGLYLVRMIQKHHGLHDINLYSPINNIQFKNIKSDNNITTNNILYQGHQPILSELDIKSLQNAKYYAKYAIGAYGLPLYMFEKTCCITTTVPGCCKPKGLNTDAVLGKTVCGWSSIKVFLKRCDNNASNLLMVNQYDALNLLQYYIIIDHDTKKLVISIRGTESFVDCVTDANAVPEHVTEIDDELYSHAGAIKAARIVVKEMMKHKLITQFLNDNNYNEYGIIVCGHSIGAAVAILVLLLLKSLDDDTIKNRHIHCYALAPLSHIMIYFDIY